MYSLELNAVLLGNKFDSDLPLMHSGQAVASTDSQVSYTAQKESGPLCVNQVQLAVSFGDRSYMTSKK